MPDFYDVSLSDVETDSGGETEAGTTQRDIIRTGGVEIAVSFNVTVTWLKLFTAFRNQPKITVRYLDTQTATLKQPEM